MRTKFYLDKRGSAASHDSTQVYPIRIAINHKGSSAYIATGISVSTNQWESKPSPGRVVGSARAARLNIALAEKKLAVDKIIEEARIAGKLHGANAAAIKALVEERLAVLAYGTQEGELPIVACFERFIATKDKDNTRGVYRATLAKLRSYGDFAERATFHTITYGWLVGFDKYLQSTSPSANARAIHLRNIRAVFNYALAESLTSAQYPFKRYKIRNEPTKDRSLEPEIMRRLRDAPCDAAREKYRDIFMLSFYLCGMNLCDMMNIRTITKGRVEVRRTKTGQPLSIRVEPEAETIINKYKGTDRLLDLTKGHDYKSFCHRLNNYLKDIGKTYNPRTKEWEGEAICPELTYYWARYTWATAAAELDIPEKTTGAALGHSTSKSVTSIYTRVDMRRKIDAANRAVIDYIFNKDLDNQKL